MHSSSVTRRSRSVSRGRSRTKRVRVKSRSKSRSRVRSRRSVSRRSRSRRSISRSLKSVTEEAASHNNAADTRFVIGKMVKSKSEFPGWSYSVATSGQVTNGGWAEGGTTQAQQVGSIVAIANLLCVNHSEEWLSSSVTDKLHANINPLFSLNPEQLPTGNNVGAVVVDTVAPPTEMLVLKSTTCEVHLTNFQATNFSCVIRLYVAKNSAVPHSPSDLVYLTAADQNSTTTASTVFPPSITQLTASYGDYRYAQDSTLPGTVITSWGNPMKGTRASLMANYTIVKEQKLNFEPGATQRFHFTINHNFIAKRDVLNRVSTTTGLLGTTYGNIRGQTYYLCIENVISTPALVGYGISSSVQLDTVSSAPIRIGYLTRKTYNCTLCPRKVFNFQVQQSKVINRDLGANDTVQVIDAEDNVEQIGTDMN